MQTYATHRRYFPLFHFFVLPFLGINFIVRIVVAVRSGGWLVWWDVVVALALVALAFTARTMALRVQDRLIALEESQRLTRCLPEDLRGRVGELRTRHLIALRFCDDAEVADLTRAVLNGEANTPAEIKKRITTWRADVRPRA